MVTQRHELSLRVLKTFSRVSAPVEPFYDDFKLQNAAHRRFAFVSVT